VRGRKIEVGNDIPIGGTRERVIGMIITTEMIDTEGMIGTVTTGRGDTMGAETGTETKINGDTMTVTEAMIEIEVEREDIIATGIVTEDKLQLYK